MNRRLLEGFGEVKVEYKSLQDFIKMIKKQNKACKKFGIKAKYEVILPLPEVKK